MAHRNLVQLLPKLQILRPSVASCHKVSHILFVNRTSQSALIISQQCFHSTPLQRNKYIINIQDDDDFKTRVTENETPVVVDFHASWCGPCKILGPKLESLVSAEEGKVILAKIDIDENTDLAMEHGVQAVPTVMGMKGGKVIDSFVGVKGDDELKSFIRKITGE